MIETTKILELSIITLFNIYKYPKNVQKVFQLGPKIIKKFRQATNLQIYLYKCL